MIKLTELLKKANKSAENIDNLYLTIQTINQVSAGRQGGPNYAPSGGRGGAADNSSTSLINNVEIVSPLNQQEIILQAIRLLSQQRWFNSNLPTSQRTGPYSYIPGVIGKPSENYGAVHFPYGELSLIVLIFVLWFLSIGLCLSKYRKLRSLHPFIPPYPGSPMHIEEVKIIKNEQDTIIYKKKPSVSNYRMSPRNKNNKENAYLLGANGLLSDQAGLNRDRSFSEPKLHVSSSNDRCNSFNKSCCAIMSHEHTFSTPTVANCCQNAAGCSNAIAAVGNLPVNFNVSADYTFKFETSTAANSHHARMERYQTVSGPTSQYGYYSPTRSQFTKYYSVSNQSRLDPFSKKQPITNKRLSDRRHLYARSKQQIRAPKSAEYRNNDYPSEDLTTQQTQPSSDLQSSIKRISTAIMACRSQSLKEAAPGSATAAAAAAASTSGVTNNSTVDSTASNSSTPILSRAGTKKRFLSELRRRETSKETENPSDIELKEIDNEVDDILDQEGKESKEPAAAEGSGATGKGRKISKETKSKSLLSKSPNLLDPNWIPLAVRESLIDMHYHLHKKPKLLQVSLISKSDSNLKSKSKKYSGRNSSMKLLSLQSTDEPYKKNFKM